MLILVLGGSASGKSHLGEQYCTALGERRLYIATMESGDAPETQARIQRHRRQREQYGFETVECTHDLKNLRLSRHHDTALLECLGNLVANEMFLISTPFVQVVPEILKGIDCLMSQSSHLVIVSNDVFAGCEQYTGDMHAYLQALGELNSLVAQKADTVVEAVCGLPLYHKGKGLL